jgi:hypothetical protein
MQKQVSKWCLSNVEPFFFLLMQKRKILGYARANWPWQGGRVREVHPPLPSLNHHNCLFRPKHLAPTGFQEASFWNFVPNSLFSGQITAVVAKRAQGEGINRFHCPILTTCYYRSLPIYSGNFVLESRGKTIASVRRQYSAKLFSPGTVRGPDSPLDHRHSIILLSSKPAPTARRTRPQ